MKQLIVRRYVDKFGTLSFSQLCTKNKDYSPSAIRMIAEGFVRDGKINRTETAHHKTGIHVVKYHSLQPVTLKPTERSKKDKVSPMPKETVDANRLKRIISKRPGITEGLLMNAAKWATNQDICRLKADLEVICIIQPHTKTRREYYKFYMNYDIP